MSQICFYVLPDGPPAEGDQVATGAGWIHWGNWVLDRHAEFPEAAHLAQEGWLDGEKELADLEHDLERILHEAGDANLTGVTAQILAALRARPEGALGVLVSDGEPGEEGGDSTAESRGFPVSESGPPGSPPRPGLVWNDATHRWRDPHSGEEVEHAPKKKAKTPAPSLAALKKNPAADKLALQALAAAAPSDAARETILDAEWNVTASQHNEGWTPDERRRHTVERLAAAWRDATDRGDKDGAEYAAEVIGHFGAEFAGPKPGETVEFNGRYYDSKHNIASGTAKVIRPPVVLKYPNGDVHVAVKGLVGPLSESVVREEHGTPPFPGAVFDTNSHRWKLPAADARDEHGAHPAETRAKSLAARIKEVPAALAAKVGTWLKAKHDTLAARYGSKGAKAILAAMVLLSPTPIPGSSLIPIALAEAALRIARAVGGKTAEATEEQLTPDQVEEIARQLLAELDDEVKA